MGVSRRAVCYDTPCSATPATALRHLRRAPTELAVTRALCLLFLGACTSIDADDIQQRRDVDNDSYSPPVDCDDTDPAVNPGQTETWYDGVDADCDGADDDDADGDGHRSETAGGEDCDDDDPAISPDAEEVCGTGVLEACGDEDTWDADCTPEDPDAWPRGDRADGADTDALGTSMAAIEDGDGWMWIVGGPGWDGEAGALWPVEPGEALVERDPTIYSRTGGDGLGAALLVADLDGDGADELVVSAMGATAVYLLSSNDLRSAGGTAEALAAAKISGAPSAGFGAVLATGTAAAGVVLAVGAPTLSDADGSTQPGGVVVYPGSEVSGEIDWDTSRALLGEADQDGFGAALASADLDGDGVDELLVGAPGRGVIYSVSLTEDPGSEDAETLPAGEEDDGLGAALVTADFTGDGIDEVAAGAPGEHVGPGAVSVYDVTADGNATTLIGPEDGMRFGASLSVLDEGDGAQLVVGAPGAAGGGGAVLLLGGDDLGALGIVDLGDAGHADRILLRLDATSDITGLGSVVAGLPDWDGDGRFELGLGAPVNADGAGSAWLLPMLDPWY